MQGKDFIIDCNGYFKSARTAEKITVEVKGMYLPKEAPGDTLLSVYSTIGCVILEFGPGLVIPSAGQTITLFDGAGLPLTGQYAGPIKVSSNASQAQVYAVYEKYDKLDRDIITSYRAPYNSSYGVKLKDGDITYQIKDGLLEMC